jgi:hypothetical protein
MAQLDSLRRGIELFNEREFFECHEVLEDQWRQERGELKDLYQAIIKIAVAFYHAQRKNYVGAVKVLRRGLAQLEPYLHAGRAGFLDLRPFAAQCTRCLAELEQSEKGLAGFDASHIPTLSGRLSEHDWE